MRLTPACLWTVAVILSAVAHAYMVDRQVVKKPFAVNQNAPLTPAEQCQLFHLDRQASEKLVRRSNTNNAPPRLTDQDYAQLWHLHDISKATSTTERHEPYTNQDRAQLWNLDRQAQRIRNDDQVSLPPRLSSQDYANLFPQTKSHGETKLTDHEPYTAQDRAQLWHLFKKPQQPHKFRHLSNQDWAQLWHLQDDKGTKIGGAAGEPSYTDQDRQLLWHLEEQGKLLHDETKRQVYSNQELAQFWHLDDDANKHHHAEESETNKESGGYTDQDRASLWHLDDDDYHHHHEKGQDSGTNAPYTPQDYQELWHL